MAANKEDLHAGGFGVAADDGVERVRVDLFAGATHEEPDITFAEASLHKKEQRCRHV